METTEREAKEVQASMVVVDSAIRDIKRLEFMKFREAVDDMAIALADGKVEAEYEDVLVEGGPIVREAFRLGAGTVIRLLTDRVEELTCK